MRTTNILALVATVQALQDKPVDWDSPVTEIVRRTLYTCPCNGIISTSYETVRPWETVDLTSTTSSTSCSEITSSSLSSTTLTSIESVTTTSGSSSSVSTTPSGSTATSSQSTTTSTISTTTTSESTTSTTTSSATTTPSITITTSSRAPVTIDEVFIAQVQFTPQIAGKLVRRDTYYLGFLNQIAYLSSSSADAARLAVTSNGNLVTGADQQFFVGATSTTGAADLEYFNSPQSLATGPNWVLGDSGLAYTGATFCVTSDQSVRLLFAGSAASADCSSVVMTPSTYCAECYNPGSTTTTTTNANANTTPSTTSTTTNVATASSTTSTTSANPEASACPDPLRQCNAVVSYDNSATSRKYTIHCDMQWSTWAMQYFTAPTLGDCLHACDVWTANAIAMAAGNATAATTNNGNSAATQCGAVGYRVNAIGYCNDTVGQNSNCNLYLPNANGYQLDRAYGIGNTVAIPV